jgi:hypothetical protein
MTKTDKHPSLRPRRMICRRINRITQSDHGTFLVDLRTVRDTEEDLTLDCKVLTEIKNWRDSEGEIIFSFEQYFPEETIAACNEAFLSGDYGDDLGDLPEF